MNPDITAPSSDTAEIRLASNAALASILNLTFLPVIGFVILLWLYKRTAPGGIGRYHVVLGMKINIAAAVALLLVSALMILLGGFNSPWTWVYVISYFTLVHSIFIVLATWALVRSWSGDRFTNRH